MTDIQPNLFAYFALLIWPVVALSLYSRLPIVQATLWTILGAYLLLPVHAEIKFEMVPGLNKNSVAGLAALIGCALHARQRPKFFHGFGLAELLIFLLLIGRFITSILNTDPVMVGATELPGVGPYDGGSAAMAEFIFILPFFLGRQYLRGAEDNAKVLRVLVIAGLLYSLPMLFEIRMSPQLHFWFYGYFPSGFGDQFRNGGFRPVVFLGHGLLVAFFGMTAAVAAAALWRTQNHVAKLPPGWICAYLCFVLLLCKTWSALVYGAIVLPLVRWAKPNLQLRVARVLVIIALAYPMLRLADVVPTASILEAATAMSADRAASLKTRFDSEQKLLDRAWERPVFGWGRYGRSRIFGAETAGKDVSTTDGHWIITIGQYGYSGFIAEFGLLALSVFRAAVALKFAQSLRESIYLAALALIVAISVVDLLPNSSLSPWTWLLVGALLGRAEELFAAAHQQSAYGRSNLSPMPIQANISPSTDGTQFTDRNRMQV